MERLTYQTPLGSRLLSNVREHDTIAGQIKEQDQVYELLRSVFTDKDTAELVKKRVDANTNTASLSLRFYGQDQVMRRIPRTVHLMLENYLFILKVTYMNYGKETYQASINLFTLKPHDVLTVNYHVCPLTLDTAPYAYPTKLAALDFYERTSKWTVNVDKMVRCGDASNSLKMLRYSGPATSVSFLSTDKRFIVRKAKELLALSSLTSPVIFNLLKLKLDNLKELEPKYYYLRETYGTKNAASQDLPTFLCST